MHTTKKVLKKNCEDDYTDYYSEFIKKYEPSEEFIPASELYKTYELECRRRDLIPLKNYKFNRNLEKDFPFKRDFYNLKIAVKRKEYPFFQNYYAKLEMA